MTYQVVFLESAEYDLKELRNYIIKNFSLKTWKATYSKIKTTTINHKKFPYSGSIPEELEKLNFDQYRQVISGMNRIIYEIRQNIVYIYIIVDSRQDLKRLLSKRLFRPI
jgi:plasmid stabilization system protein ParE